MSEDLTKALKSLPKPVRIKLAQEWDKRAKTLRLDADEAADKGDLERAVGLNKQANFYENHAEKELGTRRNLPTTSPTP